MQKTLLMAILFVLAMSSLGFAHTDPMPVVTISAVPTEAKISTVIHIFAEDTGFLDGIESIKLRENSRVIAQKDCNELPQCSFEVPVEHEGKGRFTYSAVVEDRGGNVRIRSVSVKFEGSTPLPVFVFDERPYAEEGKLLERNVLAEDFNGNGLPVTARSLPDGASFEDNVLRWTPGFDQKGTYTIRLEATDSKGQTTRDSMVIKVANTNREPVTSVITPTSGNFVMNEDSSTTFQIDVQDPDEDKPDVRWVLDGKTVSSSAKYVYRTDFNDEGSHILVARVEDKGYLKRYTWNITVNNLNREPVIREISDRKIEEGKKVRIRISGSDADKDPLSYEAVQLPAGSLFDPDTKIFTWTPEEPGVYDVSFKVRDIYGYTDYSGFQITVEERDREDLLHDLVHEALERARQMERAGTADTGATQPAPLRIVTVTDSCYSGYICSSTTYFAP